MDLIVTGSEGQLGTAIRSAVKSSEKFSPVFLSRKELDITDLKKAEAFFNQFDTQNAVLINCAAYTDVEKAESEPEKAFMINSLGAANLSEISNRYRMKMIHISTDFVFNGSKKGYYSETDMPDPLSVYGKSKLDGEKAVLKFSENNLIVRTSWLYSHTHETFLNKIIKKAKISDKLTVVEDETGSPTYASDLAAALLEICNVISNKDKIRTEIYNFCNKGKVSRYEYAKKIIEFSGLKTEVIPILSSSLNMKAKRPSNSALDNSKIISAYGIKIRNWEDALFEAVGKING